MPPYEAKEAHGRADEAGMKTDLCRKYAMIVLLFIASRWARDQAPKRRKERSGCELVDSAVYPCLGVALSGHDGVGDQSDAPFIDWQANAPRWVAEFSPNIEAETGTGLCSPV